MNTKKIRKDFKMKPHQEGGYYSELWHSEQRTNHRYLTSHIYYLLLKGQHCQWHRLTSDELWLHHQGGELTMILGGNSKIPGIQKEVAIGKDLFHLLVPAGTWQMARADQDDVLVSCVVSPGYNDADWEMYEGDS